MADAYLEGGPCDGRTHAVTAAEGDTGQIVCRGSIYQHTDPPRFHHGDIIFAFAGKVPKPPPTGVLHAPHALGGWKALRKSVNRGMPDALDYSRRVSTATLRSLARARKVRL